ncbi:dihydrodipicolinate reductase C-terminal domain-containing protein [uncultured Serinicoccus sp.]|uniref:4-hydroxy-tetrahydrodipicolinate reductase n=1 Tax=uncultured Serinicoccus sp. TaxID=735514 RepID=UPI00263856F9|nr:dihydrodipicolinate reductase C-terminal domain-containing protein [uncultured Serinicoccus sp.]
MPTSLGLFGTGRLGAAIRRLADARDDLEVRWAVGREHRRDDDLAPVDVAVDVSSRDAVADHLAWACSTGTDLVIGATGWDPSLVDGDLPVRVLVAPNFSLGVALVRRLTAVLGAYAAATDSAGTPVDLAVAETHHRHKVDAPSGTALALREALARGAGNRLEDVQTISLRLGEIVGDHEVTVATALETVTLRHTAHDRDLFAAGALTAAGWLTTRPHPGLFTLDDLAEDHLRPLLGDPAEQTGPGPDTRSTSAGAHA